MNPKQYNHKQRLTVHPQRTTPSLFATLVGQSITVTSGFVNGTEIPTLGGASLASIPTPTQTLEGLPWFTMLRVYWEPNADGETPNFYPRGIADIIEVTIEGGTSVPANTLADVDETSGATTNGAAYFILAHWIDDGEGNPVLAARNYGNRWFNVCFANDYSFIINGN